MHVEDSYCYLLMNLHYIVRILDKPIGELADVNEPILMHTYVNEGPEGGDIGDDSGKLHPDSHVSNLFNSLGEGEDFELLARVPSGLSSSLMMSLRV